MPNIDKNGIWPLICKYVANIDKNGIWPLICKYVANIDKNGIWPLISVNMLQTLIRMKYGH